MKKISILLLVITGFLAFNSCEKVETGPVIKDTPGAPAITAPTAGSNLVMVKPDAAKTVNFIWTGADYGVPLGVLYTLQVAKGGTSFATPVDVIGVKALTTTLTYAEFNAKMLALEAKMEQVNSIDMRIKASIPNSAAATIYSSVVNMNVTPYTSKDMIYLVGAFNGWNNVTANPMNRNLAGLKHELYLNFTAGNLEFKILPKQGSWDGDIGNDPANNGKLIATGENNMWVSAPGYYRISVDMQAMTWSTLATTWGVIGGFNNWGGDQAMTYDAVNGVWTTTFDIAAATEFKFRANAGWSLNFGDTGADGKLDDGGSNIVISAAGNYTITLNLNPTGNPQAYTYTIKKN
jgi:hypothetical protein